MEEVIDYFKSITFPTTPLMCLFHGYNDPSVMDLLAKLFVDRDLNLEHAAL